MVSLRQMVVMVLSTTLVCTAHAAPPTFKMLYSFQQGADGGYPFFGLVPGPDGSFFGTTQGAGNTAPFGTVFQISPPARGATAWTLTTLYNFTGGSDGAYAKGLLSTASGVLYGTTGQGGITNTVCGTGQGYGCGTVFALTPPPSGQTAWTFKTVYAFSGGFDGAYPLSPPALGSDGDLYGTAQGGGKCAGDTSGCGVVYRLTPPTGTSTVWQDATLYAFGGGAAGAYPSGTPVFGTGGVLYATTKRGGIVTSANCKTDDGCGTVFSLTPPAAGKSGWTRSTLYTFTGTVGSNPQGGVSIDAKGELFGTTHNGGSLVSCPVTQYVNPGCGAVFELLPPSAGNTKWTAKLIYGFKDGPDGSRPYDAPLIVGETLYLTSSGDEIKTDGSVIRLAPPAAGETAWKETTFYTFHDNSDSDDATGPLILSNGILYGATDGDGAGPSPAGGIFSVTR